MYIKTPTMISSTYKYSIMVISVNIKLYIYIM